MHTFTTSTIITQLSRQGEGQAGDTKDVEGGTRTRRHWNILLHVGLATAGDDFKIKLSLLMCVEFYLSCVCISVYANVYFKPTIIQ